MIVIGLIIAAGIFYIARHLSSDLSVERATSIRPFIMLAGALLIALGFEFVNGFHDTANAVATIIYTHSMEPHVAVAWSPPRFQMIGPRVQRRSMVSSERG